MTASERVKAMVLEERGRPLRCAQRDVPEPARGELLVRVRACGVCRTDLHVVDGDLTRGKLPLVPGHEVVGEGGHEARHLRLRRGGAHRRAACALPGPEVHAFTRPGDDEGQAFARSLGAAWAGDSTMLPPRPLDAAIIFAPVGRLVVSALRATRKGGTVVCAGIHMSEIPGLDYEVLWGERVLRSVANLTRADGAAFFGLASKAGVRTTTQTFALTDANEALARCAKAASPVRRCSCRSRA